MSKLSQNERLNLKKLIDQNQSGNNTENIRSLRHSNLIKKDVGEMMKIKLKYREEDKESIREKCQTTCNFLFNNYTDIFNKIVNNEIDLTIFKRFLEVLKSIEEGEIDQHEGSVVIGKILKELYIDSAMKIADKKDKEYENEKVPPVKSLNISWSEYKKLKRM
jgi:hypothetical protein